MVLGCDGDVLTYCDRDALAAVVVTMIILKPRQVQRMWPALIPGLIVIHLRCPGRFGTIKPRSSPRPDCRAADRNAPVGSGRIATLGPALRREFSRIRSSARDTGRA